MMSKLTYLLGKVACFVDVHHYSSYSSMQDDVTKGIRVLNGIAKKLKKKRLENGALTLASPEVRFNLENDSQDPVDVEMKELKETNALVEEFMLLANISVAEKIYSKFPDSALLRRHPTPPDSNFEELRRALSEFSISLETTTSKALSDSLDKAVVSLFYMRTQSDFRN